MIHLTMRQLRYFDALARLGHFGRAAEACSISQPALSMQIKEMEDALGGVLLERNARQVVPRRSRPINLSRDARAKSPSSSTERKICCRG